MELVEDRGARAVEQSSAGDATDKTEKTNDRRSIRNKSPGGDSIPDDPRQVLDPREHLLGAKPHNQKIEQKKLIANHTHQLSFFHPT